MRLFQPGATLYVPDGLTPETAIPRTTHLGIGAHSDDLEIMAFHGIRICYRHPEQWFGGITCTNGSGSARTGKYRHYTDQQMMAIRKEEQDKAAKMGQYSFMAQLDFPSSEIKGAGNRNLEADLAELLRRAEPEILYTHNPADKHDTHIGVFAAVIRAVRSLPGEARPKKVYGCEVWRDLDWMLDSDKTALDVSDTSNLGRSLVELFDSQISGGKRYDKAAFGRSIANATFYKSHEVDGADQLTFAMDLTPLATDTEIDIMDYVLAHINRFKQDVKETLSAHLG